MKVLGTALLIGHLDQLLAEKYRGIHRRTKRNAAQSRVSGYASYISRHAVISIETGPLAMYTDPGMVASKT